MKLWLLTRKETEASPIYDCADGFVIRAETEAQAREIASTSAGDEKAGTWLSADGSSCEELTTDGPPTVVLRDFHAG